MERKKLRFPAVSGTWIDETIDKKQIKWRQVLQTQLRGLAFFPFPYLLIKGIMHLSFLPSF